MNSHSFRNFLETKAEVVMTGGRTFVIVSRHFSLQRRRHEYRKEI